MSPFTDNPGIAESLREAARLLQAQGASHYRVEAYRSAAGAVEREARDLGQVLDAGGVKALDAIPHVGLGIASAIAEMLVTGRWTMLERLRGEIEPAILLRSVPGVGETLSLRLVESLHVDTLEGLEAAAADGSLEHVRGVGPRRAAALRASVEHILGRLRRPGPPPSLGEPPVGMLLELDAEYRRKATARQLRTIAPRRFNPSGQPWLPVMHAQREGWHFSVLFSNTALAHQLGRTRDWVVIYYYDGDHVERQCTVVTEFRGSSAGLRVVRGREDECRAHRKSHRGNLAIHANHAA